MATVVARNRRGAAVGSGDETAILPKPQHRHRTEHGETVECDDNDVCRVINAGNWTTQSIDFAVWFTARCLS